ncbi:hypothetical protein [Microbacterium album]|uniref:hypothetical protein n=1 Tax=Microbacterium album TaxID=2053191 RepID=UPI0016648DF7|nr:hypothetical protein [Microbacterium album]
MSDPDNTEVVASATVTSRTITDVLTLDVTVTSGADYAITANAAGRLNESQEGYAFSGADGVAQPITLPATVTSVQPLAALEAEVGEGTPLLSAHDSALLLMATLTPAQVLRLAGRTPNAARAQLTGSTGPFDCTLADPRPTHDGDVYALYCRLPTDVPSVVGATGLLALTLDERVDVPSLPIDAVAGTRERGMVYAGEGHEPRPVELGITDGAYIEIVSGVKVGDVVRIPSPSLLGSDG